MSDTFGSRLKKAWNVFMDRDPTDDFYSYNTVGYSSSYRPDHNRYSSGNDRSLVVSVLNRIALDCSKINILHVRLDENGRYIEEMDSALNNCLTLEANIDQTARAFMQDVVMSMLDEGCVAIVPTDTSADIYDTSSYDIFSMRTGKITQWYPEAVRVDVYNEKSGKREEVTIPKTDVAIIENPFYSVMNEPNSTLQRLIHKLSLLDVIDEQSGAGKLDLIIQLPYIIKSEARQRQAEERRKAIEEQLSGSKYGIAYTDGTEHITQLNRPIENNLMSQIEYLTNLLFSQLGITEDIMNGTASDTVMLNYQSRTIEPIMLAITGELKRKFLTKTARSQRQSIEFFSDPFKLVPVSQIADIADKFTRNEIMSSNEIRQIVGLKPVEDPQADELRNKNINPGEDQRFASTKEQVSGFLNDGTLNKEEENQNGSV